MGLGRSKKLIASCLGLLLAASYSSSDYLIDDFNDGNNTNELDTYWYFYNDVDEGGSSTVVNDPFETGGIVDGVATMNFSLGDSAELSSYTMYPSVAMGFNFVETGTYDLTGATAISFKIKADQALKVKFVIEVSDVTDHNDLHNIISVTGAWQTVTILLENDPDLGLKQENWGSTSKKVTYNPAHVTKLAIKVRGNENKDLINKSGTLYVDDITLIGTPKIKRWGELDPVASGSFTGTGLISDFEGDYPLENKLLGAWYNYTDVDIEGTSAFTQGVDEGVLTSTANGGVTGGGINVSYLLGSKIAGTDDSIAPFVGIGTNLNRNAKVSFNATTAGATGIYFEYKSDVFVDVELEDSISRGSGIVYFAKLPPSSAWTGAKIPFDSLKLPKWVKSGKPLAKTSLRKIQFKLSDAAGTMGEFALDNVYLMDATIVGVKSRIPNLASKGITVGQRNNVLEIMVDKRLGDSKVSLINPMGKIVQFKNVSANARACSLPLGNSASGVYLLKVSSANGQVETSPLHIIR